ncbi:MAG: imidazoleglycerol-phosphate dehydratase HisB [Lachnospiraceae bacterium]|nr:imidazoleglycerol-phosphate dehydratase HisB [Lachnospiraceae bacterium]
METERRAKVARDTKETNIVCDFKIDGNGVYDVDTGIGFFNHMLEGFARHGFFDLKLKAKGDLNVDSHHTVEDVGIVLGQAIREALGDKAGITRYGFFLLPMDETLVECAIDLSGRPYFVYDVRTTVDKLGEMDVEMAKEFFYAISYSAGMNLHIRMISGDNNHHILEAMFKAFAKALDMATRVDPRIEGVLSTKGTI